MSQTAHKKCPACRAIVIILTNFELTFISGEMVFYRHGFQTTCRCGVPFYFDFRAVGRTLPNKGELPGKPMQPMMKIAA